jgi:hypothetical protein
MDKVIYLIALVIALLVGLRFKRNAFKDEDDVSDEAPQSDLDYFKEVLQKGGLRKVLTESHDEWTQTKMQKKVERKKKRPKHERNNPLKAIDLKWLVGSIVVCLLLTAFMDFTWAYFISSYPWVIFWLALALIFGFFVSLSLDVLKEVGVDGVKVGVGAIFAAVFIPLIFTFIHIYAAVVVLIVAYIWLGRKAFGSPKKALMSIKGFAAMFAVSLLIMGMFNPMVHPEGIDNPLYSSLEANETKAPQTNFVDNITAIRVISWDLATQYLQRAYGESASVLETDPNVLSQNTDPSYVDGKFVWVNAPQYQFLKWTGDKEVPFFVYVVNDPGVMNKENPDIVHKVNTPLKLHKERIEWKNRLWHLPFDKYAGQYEVTQIRIDMDDHYNPYWIIYLSERCVRYNMPDLKKIIIVSVSDINDYTEYDVSDLSNIPAWLEVVYPDQYVYEWVSYWGSYRQGLVYSWFNKKHLYDPDDLSARFIIIQNRTYWQVPVRQKDSEVLGGFVQVDTRSGKATFWNREDKSYVGLWTVEQQIVGYLSSGQVGFQQLTIHEGYLYPIKMNDGSVREAYIFPLYAGFTVQKYAIVDAELYTAAPVIDTSLQDALDKYMAKGATNQTNDTWMTYSIVNAYAEPDDVVVTLNDTHTYTVTADSLKGGLIDQSKDEFVELKLAVAEHQRTGNVTIDAVLDHGKMIDVDYLGADLVKRP